MGWYPDYGTPTAPGHGYFAGYNVVGADPGPLEKLSTLKTGDVIELADADGRTARYTVIDARQYTPEQIPFGDILAGKGRPADASWITVLTAGGRQDAAGNYLDFEVVVAERED